jgi:uncharacterized membrane protein
MANGESVISPKKRKLLIAIWILALTGFGVSLELTRIYYESYRNVDFSPFCAINQQVNCVSVALSKYSSILGLPVSGYGMATYLLMLLVIPFRLRGKPRIFSHLENYLALMAIFCMCMTIYLASVSTLFGHFHIPAWPLRNLQLQFDDLEFGSALSHAKVCQSTTTAGPRRGWPG